MSQRFLSRALVALMVVFLVLSSVPQAQQAVAQEAPSSTPTATSTMADAPLRVRAGHTTVSRELEIARKKLSTNPTVTPTVTPTATPKQAGVAVTPTSTSVAQTAQATPAPLVERDVRPDEWGGHMPEYWNDWGIGPVDDQIPSYWNSGWSHTYQNPYEGTRACISGPSTNGDFSMGQSGIIPTESQWMTLVMWLRIEHPQGQGTGATYLEARLRTPSGVLATYRVATSQSLVASWSLLTIVVEESVLSAIRGRAVSLDLVAYGREQGNLTRFVVDHWGAMVGGDQDPTNTPTATPSPTPTATPTSTPTPRPSNNAAQIARIKIDEEGYRRQLGENVRGPEATHGVIELTPMEADAVSAELKAQIRELASRERQPIPFVGLSDPANGWFRFAHVADNATGSESINTHLVLGGNSGVYSVTPQRPDQAMSILQWAGARGRDWAPRKIEASLVLYPTTAECTTLTMALTDRQGNVLQIGTSGNLCSQFQWQRFRMNLDPVESGEYGVFIQSSNGDVRLDDIEGLYNDPRVGLVSYLPIPGSTGLCAPGYSQIVAPGSTSGRVIADELLLEGDDVVYPGNLSPVLDDVPAPGQWLCRIAEEHITYAVGGMGQYRVDFSTVVAGVGTLAIPRGLITGTTLVAGTAGTTTTGLIPIGTLTGLGGGIVLGAGAAVYGFGVWHSYNALADTLDLAEISTTYMDSDDGSGPYMVSFRFRPPVPTVYLKESTFEARPQGLVEKYLLNSHGEASIWDLLGQSAPGAQGPFGYSEAVSILMQRTVQIPEALGGTHPRSGHAAIHPGGQVYEAKRGGIWVKTNNQCKTNPQSCKCWQRTSDSVILMFAEGARVVYDTGSTIGNIGIVILRKADLVIGLNDDFISTALGNIRFDAADKPIGFSNLGPNDVNRVNCPNIFGNNRDNWPHDSSGLLPG